LYDPTAPLFQPGADERGDQGAERRPSGLREELVLQLTPMALRREQGTDQSAAGPLYARESIAGRDAACERERGDDEMTEEDLHEICIT
jgi:hypothetical protein